MEGKNKAKGEEADTEISSFPDPISSQFVLSGSKKGKIDWSD
jgi:hypothetical protein